MDCAGECLRDYVAWGKTGVVTGESGDGRIAECSVRRLRADGLAGLTAAVQHAA